VTESELELNNVFQPPNFTICIDGWPKYDDTIFWSPLGADFDAPAWPNAVIDYIKNELHQLSLSGESVLTQKWTLHLWLYVEYYVKL
jgi:hypothetical protein